jgi:hypothetical protein
MAFRRFMDGLNWVTDKTKKVYRALPAAAKVTAMMGQAAFNGDKFAAWVLKAPSGFVNPFSIGLGSVLAIGVGVDNIVGRAFNMYRREESPSPPPSPAVSSDDNPDGSPPALSASEIARLASFWSPGLDPETLAKNLGYKLFQLHCALYIGNSAMGGYLGEFSLAQLIAKIPGLKLDSTCEASRSSYAGIIAVHLAAFYSSYSSILSYFKYNLVRMREYYIYYIIQKHWHDIGFLSSLETLVGVSINTIGIIVSNKHTWELVEKNSLCHTGAESVPIEAVQSQSATAALANFIVSIASTLPAVHKRNTNLLKTELATLLAQVPSCQPWDKFIRLCNFIAGVNAAVGTVYSVAKLPETIHAFLGGAPSDMEDFSYEWWMVTLAGIAGVIALKNQLALSYEAYAGQLEAWAKENAEARRVENESLQAPLLAASPPGGLPIANDLAQDHVININDMPVAAVVVETPPPTQTKARDNLSVAPSATLFGASNPANPNAVRRDMHRAGSNDVLIEPSVLVPGMAAVGVLVHA